MSHMHTNRASVRDVKPKSRIRFGQKGNEGMLVGREVYVAAVVMPLYITISMLVMDTTDDRV